MFDVIWTDPDKELVGEHRARKEKRREQKDREKEKEKIATARRSLSTRSSHSSVDSPFGFLKAKAKANAKQKSTAGSSLMSPSILSSQSPLSSDCGSHRHSSLSADVSQSFSEAIRHTRSASQTRSEISRDAFETASTTSSYDCLRPILSRYAETDFTPDSSDKSPSVAAETSTKLVQALGPSSFITKRTEVSWTSRSTDSEPPNLTTKTSITSEPDTDQPLTPPVSSTGGMGFELEDGSFLDINTMRLWVPPSNDSPVNLVPGPKSPLRPQSPTWSLSFKPNNPDAWKAPEEWDRISEAQSSAPEDLADETFASGLDDGDPSAYLDLNTLQREVKRMAAASPRVMLSRIKEVWNTSADSSLHQELEMEKKRWMLSVLQHLDPAPENDILLLPRDKVSPTGVSKILALFESKVAASYLAAWHATKQVHHMSASPLSHSFFPNIHPVLVPSVSSTAFPLPPLAFEAAYSLTLPALCPACDIPRMLRNVHKSLKPGGFIQVTVVDPLPCAGTLGPLMRAWIEEHLLLNLERRFRCMNPSKLLPHWLKEASLRGKGSTLTSAKFYAVPKSVRAQSQFRDVDGPASEERSDSETRAELRTLVGRMLWMEVWGAYVTGGSWWWEQEALVEECLQQGTFWEYHIMEGVREDEDRV